MIRFQTERILGFACWPIHRLMRPFGDPMIAVVVVTGVPRDVEVLLGGHGSYLIYFRVKCSRPAGWCSDGSVTLCADVIRLWHINVVQRWVEVRWGLERWGPFDIAPMTQLIEITTKNYVSAFAKGEPFIAVELSIWSCLSMSVKKEHSTKREYSRMASVCEHGPTVLLCVPLCAAWQR